MIIALLWCAPAAAEPLPTVASLFDGTPFSEDDVRNVLKGDIVVTTVKYSSDRELSVGLACLVARTFDPMVPFDQSRPMLPGDGVDQYGQIDLAHPHRGLEKFELGKDDREELERFIAFRSGVGLNLSPDEIASFEAVRNSHDDPVPLDVVNNAVRGALTKRVSSYRGSGLSGIAPYSREDGRLANPSAELGTIIDQSTGFQKYFPRFLNMWRTYPLEPLRDATESYYWVRSTVDKRPMVVLAHQVGWQDGETRFMGERLFYVSHFFNTGHMLALSTPTREGRLFVLIDRVWIDGYSGMPSIKHSLGQRLLTRQLRDQVKRRKVCVVD